MSDFKITDEDLKEFHERFQTCVIPEIEKFTENERTAIKTDPRKFITMLAGEFGLTLGLIVRIIQSVCGADMSDYEIAHRLATHFAANITHVFKEKPLAT